MATVSQLALVYEPPPTTFSPASPLSSTPTPPVRNRSSHYRPFSTLYTESPYVEFRDKDPHCLKRHSSLSGLQAFVHMGLGLKDKAKAKKIISPVPLQVSDPIEIKPCTPRLPPSHNIVLQTSSEIVKPTPTLHRVKKKRSMASLFAGADPVAPASSLSGSISPSPGPHSLLSLPHPVDVPMTSSISVSIGKRTRFLDHDLNDHDSSHKFVPKSIWAKRHNMKLHPYHQDVPYMQAYDPILLERYILSSPDNEIF